MRRFLLSLLFVGVLSAVFSLSVFADECVSGYQSSGVSVSQKSVTFNVSADAGDQFYFDVSVNHQSDIIKNPSGVNITAQVNNRDINWHWSITPTGSSCAAARVQVEGNSRIWIFFDRPVSGSITINFYITYTNSWSRGIFNGTPSQDLNNCSCVSTWAVSYSNLNKFGSGWATDQTNSVKLDRIISMLDGESTAYLNFLGDEAVFYARNDYFNHVNGATYNSNGWPVVSNFSDVAFFNDSTDTHYQPGYFLQPGTYLVYVFYPAGVGFQSIAFEGATPDSYSYKITVIPDLLPTGYYCTLLELDVKEFFTYTVFHLSLASATGSPVPVYLGIVPADSDYLAGNSLNPEQDGLSRSIDDAGRQQSQQESDMWQNINTYKSDISFGLDGWNEASNGLSYVTGVFMTVWNNSPTQPIVLSLMLGIAMLSIGRGVMAAVRVQKKRSDD